MTTRIVVTGPESTGKTTLAQELATALGAPMTLEAARLFAESSSVPLSAATVEPIARLSMRLEDEALTEDRPRILVRDTDLVSTVVYARHYYGGVPGWIVTEASARRADFYLLCRPDLPWVADGVRDRPHHRQAMFDAFADSLRDIGARVETIGGTGTTRLSAALGAARAFLATAPDDPSYRPHGRDAPRTP